MYNFCEAGSQYIHKINVGNDEEIALALFRYQYEQNPVYRSFVEAIHITPSDVTTIDRIPFLPISFFKTHDVVSGMAGQAPALVFESSGTTGSVNSRHQVFRQELYHSALLSGFRNQYGAPSQYAILALLPSYLERKNASLVHMAQVLMQESHHPLNGFFLDDWNLLQTSISALERAGQPALLLGVTFALLDFAEACPLTLQNTIVMETGGMKGRKEEWTRAQVHCFLEEKFRIREVHSEYGMTELLSQAYAPANGVFRPSATMKVMVRDLNDPLETRETGTGALNVIDLANVDSCAFIATEDIGTVYADGTFEVLGRLDHSALRGCSLMTVQI